MNGSSCSSENGESSKEKGCAEIKIQVDATNFDKNALLTTEIFADVNVPSLLLENDCETAAFDCLIEDLNCALNNEKNGCENSVALDVQNLENFGGPGLNNMTKFYAKFSQQCAEIERLEKTIQKLHDQLKSVSQEKNASQNQVKDLSRNHSNKVAELEKRLFDVDSQSKINRERFNAQDELMRKNYLEKEAKLATQIEQLKKSNDVAKKERDNAVIKYAQREKEILTLESSERKLQQQLQQLGIERDALNSRLRGSKNEKEQLLQVLAQKENDASECKRKYDDLKSLSLECEIKAKMADKRVEIIDKSHVEVRSELEKVSKKLKESKEENATLKANYEQMIQLQCAIKEQSIDSENSENKSVEKQNESVDPDENLLNLEENKALNAEIVELRTEIAQNCSKIDLLTETLKAERLENETLQKSVENYKQISDKYDQLKLLHEGLKRRADDLQLENADLEQESASFRLNAENMLELTQKLTDKNSHLHSENISVTSRLTTIERESTEIANTCQDLKAQLVILTQESEASISLCRSEIEDLKARLTTETAKAAECNTLIEDERNQNRILKKKHAAAVKDLKSEIFLQKRRLDAYEAGTASQCSTGSLADEHAAEPGASSHSRSPSMTSLDVANNLQVQFRQKNVPGLDSPHFDQNAVNFHPLSCEHNQAMIEKIVKLQRMLARRAEKIEFLEEHVRHMTVELQKKSRIIQMYVLRDENSGLAPESMDINKLMALPDQAQFVQKGNTVMSRVFGGNFSPMHVNNVNQLSPDLAVQIMSKLQALFEDAVLKNITLKENLQTLGEEIASMSLENRTLKHQLNQS